MKKKKTIAEKRNYAVKSVKDAKEIAQVWLEEADLQNALNFGLPEIDDRYHVWRVPFLAKFGGHRIGEVVIDANTSLIQKGKSTDPTTLEARLLGRKNSPKKATKRERKRKKKTYQLSDLRNTIAFGDSEEILPQLPAESADLIFTSPPYYNARPEYADYVTYEEYLLKIRKIIQASHRVLSEGRFFVMNVSPVLIRRAKRSESSRRIAVPFDIHRLFVEEKFDFIEDIIWAKPEGAGWATSRGRRFAADRKPLQYKTVPVTEYVLVYRKRTKRLIDWNIRSHPNQNLVNDSLIDDGYERTNIWEISPSRDKDHPAVFPLELAEKVIRYYSFKKDVVLDPFAGIGTVGHAASVLGRRFVLIENEEKYIEIIREKAKEWLGKRAKNIFTIGCSSIDVDDMLF